MVGLWPLWVVSPRQTKHLLGCGLTRSLGWKARNSRESGRLRDGLEVGGLGWALATFQLKATTLELPSKPSLERAWHIDMDHKVSFKEAVAILLGCTKQFLPVDCRY